MKKYLIAMIAVLGMGTLTPAFAGDVFTGAVIGGTAGAVIGHQFDGRNSEAIGAVIGAGIGASMADDNNRSRYSEPRYGYAEPVEYRPAYGPRGVVVVRDNFYGNDWHDNGRHRGWYKKHRGHRWDHDDWHHDRGNSDWGHGRGDHDWNHDRGDHNDDGHRDDGHHRDRH